MKGTHMTACILLWIGGLNWGLVGLGWVVGGGADWNVVHMLLGSWPTVEGIVYILVGLAALYEIFTHKKTCKMCGSGSSM